MRNLLALLLLVVVIVLAVGWYYGWYHVRQGPGAPGQENVQIEINKQKAENDIHHSEREVRRAFDNTTEKLRRATARERSTGR